MKIKLFLLYLQQGAMIINRNVLGDESLAVEKLCTVLFGTGQVKITMKCNCFNAK